MTESGTGRISSPVSHLNNFDLLRFVLASVVFIYHSHVLSGSPELAVLSRWFSAEFAVESFFVVSGFLVFSSFEHSASTRAYFGKRLRRIYPAYAAVVLGVAMFGALFTSVSLSDYFSVDWLRYLAANLTFLNFLAADLPGLFENNAWRAVNGALWTLKIEVAFYVSVPVIAIVCARLGRSQTLAALYLLSVAYVIAMEQLAAETGQFVYVQLARQLPGQLCYFVGGAACFYFRDVVAQHWRWASPLSLLLLLAPMPHTAQIVIEPAALAVVVTFIAVGARYFGNFGRYGDFSYGIYIVHFPILQILVSIGLFAANPYLALGVATIAVLAAAFACWHLVEKPFLQRSSHYVVAARFS